MIPRQNLISAVIPCYNGEPFLARAVESVLAQTAEPIEVIIVDDGSSDGSRSIAAGFESDPRIKVVSHERNRGIAAARNSGIAASSGLFIAFLDQDDYWLPEKLERQMAVFANDGAGEIGLVFTDIRVEDDRGRTIRRKRGRTPRRFNRETRIAMLRSLYQNNFIPIVSALIRRECFDTVGLLNEAITNGGDDYEYALRLLTLYKAYAIDDALAVRTVHATNYTDAALMNPEVVRVIDAFAERVPEVRDLRERRKANLLCETGGYYSRLGDSRNARRYYREALKCNPGKLKASLGYLGSSSGFLGRSIARLWYGMRDSIGRPRE